ATVSRESVPGQPALEVGSPVTLAHSIHGEMAHPGDVENTVVEHLREPRPPHAIDLRVHVALLLVRLPRGARRELDVGSAQLVPATAHAVARFEARAHLVERGAPRTAPPLQVVERGPGSLAEAHPGASVEPFDRRLGDREFHRALPERDADLEVP